MTPADGDAKELLVNLAELLSPPTNSDTGKEEDHAIALKTLWAIIEWSITAESSKVIGFLNSMEVTLSLYLQAVEIFQISLTGCLKPISAAIVSTALYARVSRGS